MRWVFDEGGPTPLFLFNVVVPTSTCSACSTNPGSPGRFHSGISTVPTRRGVKQGLPLTGPGDPLMSLVKPCHDWPRPDGTLGGRWDGWDGWDGGPHNCGQLFVAMQMRRESLVIVMVSDGLA